MKSKFMAVPLLALCANTVFAVEPITKEFRVVAEVPVVEFTVEPKGNWMANGVRLNYNESTQDFDAVSEVFEAKNSAGAIEAKLTNVAVLNEKNGGGNIDLAVTVGGQLLNESLVEVMSPEAAKVGGELTIALQAQKPEGGYVGGEYEGTVALQFEAAAPL